jgi:hypothetical protein
LKCGSFIWDEQFQKFLSTHALLYASQVQLKSHLHHLIVTTFRGQQLVTSLCKVYKYNGMQTWSSDLDFVIFKIISNILNRFECLLNTLLQTELATTFESDLYFLNVTVIFKSPFKTEERLDLHLSAITEFK